MELLNILEKHLEMTEDERKDLKKATDCIKPKKKGFFGKSRK
jgi:hypothetical protein